MAKVCIQCDKKLGMFQKPVDSVYCSTTCRDAAKAQIVEHERISAERVQEAERISQELVQKQAAQAADAARRGTCPKCSKAWTYVAGGGPGGSHRGDCPACGFSATFVEIETCKTCRGFSMIMETEKTGRCPRCKSKR
jgi:hypothetical protein